LQAISKQQKTQISTTAIKKVQLYRSVTKEGRVFYAAPRFRFQISLIYTKSARNKERRDAVLVHNNHSVPWVLLSKLFTHVADYGDTCAWALVQTYKWFDFQVPIDPNVVAPHIKEEFSETFAVIPVTDIWQTVQLIPNGLNHSDRSFWVNWWITAGKSKYPIDHFDECMKNLPNSQ
jgi:hypothetical protein